MEQIMITKKQGTIIAIVLICFMLLSSVAIINLYIQPAQTTQTSDDFVENCVTISLRVPITNFNKDPEMKLSARELLVDDSFWDYEMLANVSSIGDYHLKCGDADYVNYSKAIDIKDYATMEDVLVQLFINMLQEERCSDDENKGIHAAMPLSWFTFYDEFDFSQVNEDRLRFKCELIAQNWGWTTYGSLGIGDDCTYFTVNCIPLKDVVK